MPDILEEYSCFSGKRKTLATGGLKMPDKFVKLRFFSNSTIIVVSHGRLSPVVLRNRTTLSFSCDLSDKEGSQII